MESFQNILYVVMPAYNEEENIEKVIRQWYPVLAGKSEASKLVIADSGSTDRTHEILMALQREYSQLEILSDTGKMHGPKLMALYDYAIQNGAEYVFQTDSDGQTNPEEFETFWELRKEFDGIFGHRKVRGDGIVRAFVARVVSFLLKLYFHVDIPDANAPFRLMKCDVVKKYLYKMDKAYNLPNIMLTTYFKYYSEKTAFHTITFMPRQGGKNSINIWKIVKHGMKALTDFKMFKKEMKN